VFALHVLLMIVKSGAFALTESRSAAVRRTAELEV